MDERAPPPESLRGIFTETLALGEGMGIRFLCHDCDRKLNVKDFLAGKRGICPYCGASVMIPTESQLPASGKSRAGLEGTQSATDEDAGASVMIATQGGPTPQQEEIVKFPAAVADSPADTPVESTAGESTPVDPIEENPDAIWYVRPPSGGQYGPADGDVMRRWISEKRVSAEGLVWRDGWPEWKKGSEVFPQLFGQAPPAADPATPATTPSVDTKIATDAISAGKISEPREAAGRYASRKKRKQGVGIAAIIVLGVLIAVLAVTLVVIVANKS